MNIVIAFLTLLRLGLLSILRFGTTAAAIYLLWAGGATDTIQWLVIGGLCISELLRQLVLTPIERLEALLARVSHYRKEDK
jgi:hypothetical protein